MVGTRTAARDEAGDGAETERTIVADLWTDLEITRLRELLARLPELRPLIQTPGHLHDREPLADIAPGDRGATPRPLAQ